MISLTDGGGVTGPSNDYITMRTVCLRFKTLMSKELLNFKNGRQTESSLVLNGMKMVDELKILVKNLELDENEDIEYIQYMSYIIETLDNEFDTISGSLRAR